MASAFTSPLSLFAGIPAGESSTGTGRRCSSLRRVCAGRSRSGSLKNRSAWLSCRDDLLFIPWARIRVELWLVRGSHCSMASLEGDDEPVEEEQSQSPYVITDRFSEGLAWDPYLGEVTANEKVEESPQYVPPPPIPADEIRIRDKVELLLYTLKRVLPGQLDNDKADALCSMLSAMVEVQNPAVCFRGSNKCSEWLKALIQMKASVNLHEVYYENDTKDPDKRWVYAVWTLRFLENINTNSSNLIESSSPPEAAQLSGETVLEMEKSGPVSRISSTWYILEEDDGAFTKAKDSLLRLLGRTF